MGTLPSVAPKPAGLPVDRHVSRLTPTPHLIVNAISAFWTWSRFSASS